MQHAMKLRGALVACGPGMRGAGWPDTACVRLVALGPWLGKGLCASHLTAAWVWSASERPGPPLSIAALPGRHSATRITRGVRRHELRLRPEDWASFEELRVTLPLRTAIDLLHDPKVFNPHHAEAVAALVKMQPGGSESVRRRLQEHRRPHRRLAEQRLGTIFSRLPRGHAVRVVDTLDATDGVKYVVEMGRVRHLEKEAADRETGT